MYASSSAQLTEWLRGWGVPAGPVAPLPVEVVAPGIRTRGPVDSFTDEIRTLHARLRGTPDSAELKKA